MHDGGLLWSASGQGQLQVSEGGTQVGEGLVEEKVQVVDGTHVVKHVWEEKHKVLIIWSLDQRGLGGLLGVRPEG